jgi:NADPH:quinone reductase-like Zn-dependent oxidoreductase
VEPPYVPGGAFAGHVLSVGAGVDPAWVGRRVAARTNAAGGGYAEQAVVAADTLIDVPEELGLPEATAVLTDGPTARPCFRSGFRLASRGVMISVWGVGIFRMISGRCWSRCCRRRGWGVRRVTSGG